LTFFYETEAKAVSTATSLILGAFPWVHPELDVRKFSQLGIANPWGKVLLTSSLSLWVEMSASKAPSMGDSTVLLLQSRDALKFKENNNILDWRPLYQTADFRSDTDIIGAVSAFVGDFLNTGWAKEPLFKTWEVVDEIMFHLNGNRFVASPHTHFTTNPRETSLQFEGSDRWCLLRENDIIKNIDAGRLKRLDPTVSISGLEKQSFG
jgi:hypothetical protein